MAQDHVQIKRGVQRLFGVGGIEVAVDRVTGQRAIVVQVPGGRWPTSISTEDYLRLGIEIIRDSGVVHDFSETIPDPSAPLPPDLRPLEFPAEEQVDVAMPAQRNRDCDRPPDDPDDDPRPDEG